MAIGQESNFQIYNEQFYAGANEVAAQASNLFNANSRGTILLGTEQSLGDYKYESFIQSILSGSKRTTTGSSAYAAQTATPTTQGANIGVRCSRKLPYVADTEDKWRKIGEDDQHMSFILGQQAQKAIQLDMLNTAAAAVAAALANQVSNTYEILSATLNSAHLVSGLKLLGDRAGSVAAWLAHSAPYYDLLGNQITANILEVSGFNLREGAPVTLGRPAFVTDASGLFVDNTGQDYYYTLGLQPGAVKIEQQFVKTYFTFIPGLEGAVWGWQVEYDFFLSIMGFKWDTANGGVNPTDAALATGSNWDQASTSDKDLAGICIKSR